MLAEEIAKSYGAVNVTLQPIRDGQGGASIMEATVDGVRHALRISGPFLSARPPWVEFEGELLTRLKSHVPVAAAVRGVDGRFGQSVEGGIALLTEWADGDIEWPTPAAKAHQLGGAVAALHEASEGVGQPREVRPFDTQALLDRPMGLIAEVADPNLLWPFVEEMRERFEAIYQTAQTFGPIHGDVHQGNCHFDGDRVTLFDFAQCGIGWRAFDLAGFLWPWRDDSIMRPELRTSCDHYLAGYRSARELTNQEEQALPAFVRARDLWEAGEWVATGSGREKPHELDAGIRSWAERWSACPMLERLP